MNGIFTQDVGAIVDLQAPHWERLHGANLFFTGASGLLGRWMLHALFAADERFALGVKVTALSRDPSAFAERDATLAADPRLHLIAGDVTRPFDVPDRTTHVIHAATDASAHLNENDPRRMFDTIVTGTRHALDGAVAQKARFFFLSSGAVYGVQPPGIDHVAESYRGAPDQTDPVNAYGEGKRAAEMLCGIYAKQFGLEVVNARIFALIGPLLPLGIHFAAGNFLLDAMADRRIQIRSSGTAVRSYLYLADVVGWLWAILLRGAPGAVYNVGSEEAVSIAELARRVAAVLGGPGVDVLGRDDRGWNPGRYVPSTARIRNDLGVGATVDLDQAILRTAQWNGWQG